MGDGGEGRKSLRNNLRDAAANIPSPSTGLKRLGESVRGRAGSPSPSGKQMGDSVRSPAASVRLKNAVTINEARKLAREMDRRQSFDPRASTKAIIAGTLIKLRGWRTAWR